MTNDAVCECGHPRWAHYERVRSCYQCACKQFVEHAPT
jgi:hypothetical protein